MYIAKKKNVHTELLKYHGTNYGPVLKQNTSL